MNIPESWKISLSQFVDYLVSIGQSENSVITRWYQLSRLARAMPDGPDSVTEPALTAWLSSRNWNLETRHSTTSALRVYFQWATRNGYCKTDPAARLPSVKRPRRVARPVPDDVWLHDRQRAPYRVKLMIDLAALLGMRRCEIARVHSKDVMHDDGGWVLLVHGKGNKERLLPITETLAKRLTHRDGWVFPSYPDATQHLTAGHIGKLIEKLTDRRWTLHQLRHRFGTTIWRQTHDLLAVQTLLGHESPKTTEIYIAFPDDRLREVILLAEPQTISNK